MKYTGITYRPPFEAGSLLLQVTSGCSHNKCSFCTMYRDVPFQVETVEQIEKDLEEAKAYAPYIKRVFLENGDPFVLSADKLEKIATMIHEKLPNVETIAMYASIGNVRTKTDEELQSGKFVENTVEEYLVEEKVFLEYLQLENCYYFGLHPSNIVPMEGWISRDKDAFLKHVERKQNSLSPEQLNSRPIRSGEGAVLLQGNS